MVNNELIYIINEPTFCSHVSGVSFNPLYRFTHQEYWCSYLLCQFFLKCKWQKVSYNVKYEPQFASHSPSVQFCEDNSQVIKIPVKHLCFLGPALTPDLKKSRLIVINPKTPLLKFISDLLSQSTQKFLSGTNFYPVQVTSNPHGILQKKFLKTSVKALFFLLYLKMK